MRADHRGAGPPAGRPHWASCDLGGITSTKAAPSRRTSRSAAARNTPRSVPRPSTSVITAQAGREVDPAASAEHAGIGAQGIAEEARGACGIEALSVCGVRLAFPFREVVLLAATAVGRREKGPAVGGDLEGVTQGCQSWTLPPQGGAFSGADHNGDTTVHCCHEANAVLLIPPL